MDPMDIDDFWDDFEDEEDDVEDWESGYDTDNEEDDDSSVDSDSEFSSDSDDDWPDQEDVPLPPEEEIPMVVVDEAFEEWRAHMLDRAAVLHMGGLRGRQEGHHPIWGKFEFDFGDDSDDSDSV